MFPIWAIDLFLFCFRMKMKTLTVLKNKTRKADSGADSGVHLGVDLEAVGVVFKEDATRVVVAVLEVDAAAIGVDVGAIVMIEVVAEVVVVLGAVAVVVEIVVEVVLRIENLGAETIEITTDQENHGEMRTAIEEVLRVVSIKGNLLIFRDHLRIKRSLLMINVEYMFVHI